MKINIKSILEALFMPKPNEHLRRNYSDSRYGSGLILVPIPEQQNDVVQQIKDRMK